MKKLFRRRRPLGDDVARYGSAAERAAELYDRGFNCAEAVLQAVTGREDKELVALARGFGDGIGESGCLCGAISGGVMVLGLCGRSDRAGELVAAFRERFGSSCCRALTRDFKRLSREHLAHCRELTAQTAALVAELLEE